jgi:hypothetical protein
MGDRPLMRRLIKLAMTVTGPATAHRQDIWPGLTIDRPTGQVGWQGHVLNQLVPFGDIVSRQLTLIAVVGSGPSLAQQHLERLPDRSAILLNGAASLADRVVPLAVIVEDERFVFRHIAMLSRLAADVPLMLSPAALRAIAERNANLLQHRKIALIDNIAKPVNGPRRALSDPQLDPVLVRDSTGGALSDDPDQGVVICGTVALTAVQVALQARPAQIVLAGIDLTNATAPRFYETATKTAPSGIVAGLGRIMAGFSLALHMAQAQDTTLLCASPVSALLDLGIPRTKMLS